MATKANHHPLVRDLRRLLDKHGLSGCVMLGITKDGNTIAASAGHDVKTCNALGPILDEPEIDLLFIEMFGAVEQGTKDKPQLSQGRLIGQGQFWKDEP